MFEFIWHLKGSVALDASVSNDVAMANVKAMLKKQRKPITEDGHDFVVFYAPLWQSIFGPNWLTLVIYDRGRIWIDNTPSGRLLRYDLRSLHGLIYVLTFAVLILFITSLGNGLIEGLMISGVMFAWLYGMNIVLALIRVPFLFRKAARI